VQRELRDLFSFLFFFFFFFSSLPLIVIETRGKLHNASN